MPDYENLRRLANLQITLRPRAACSDLASALLAALDDRKRWKALASFLMDEMAKHDPDTAKRAALRIVVEPDDQRLAALDREAGQ